MARTKTLNKLISYVPIIGLFFILAGNIKLLVYYKSFNLQIFPFVGIDEILILFMQNLVGYLILTIIGVLSSTFAVKRLRHWVFGISVVATLVFQYFRPNRDWIDFIFILVAFFIMIYTVPIIIKYISEFSRQLLPIAILTIVLLSVSAYAGLSGMVESRKVKDGYYSNVQIEFENGRFQSGSTCFYIGHTKNHLFIHDLRSGATTSYSMSSVKSIRFQKH